MTFREMLFIFHGMVRDKVLELNYWSNVGQIMVGTNEITTVEKNAYAMPGIPVIYGILCFRGWG